MSTQWTMGPNGPVGMNYSLLFLRMDRLKIPAEQQEGIYYDFRVMEIAALDTMRSQR
jgi:hypothetical protein